MAISVGDLFDRHSEDIQVAIKKLDHIDDVSQRNEEIQAIVKRELSFNQEIHHRGASELQKATTNEITWFHLVQKLLNLYQPTSQEAPSTISKAFQVFGVKAPLYLSLPPDQLEKLCEAKIMALTPGTINPVGAKTANGVYLLSSEEQSNKQFIMKPIAQEEGMPGNPQGNTDLRKTGFTAGQGAIKERLAFNLQQRLGCDFGIPFTEVVEIEHPLLTSTFGIAQNIATLLKGYFKIDKELDLSQIALAKAKGLPMDALLMQLIQYINNEGDPERQLICEILGAHLEGRTISKVALIQLAKKHQFPPSHKVVALALRIINILKAPPPHHSLCSIQEFIPSKSYGHFTFDELSQISDQEMHKCIFDIAIYNCDRHMNNILFNRKQTGELGVVLIDHGLCFPDSKALENGPRLEWNNYPQFKNPLVEPFASRFRDLDIDRFMIDLRADQALLEITYPEYGKLSEESYSLLELNLHLIQQGVRSGVSIQAMALFIEPNLQTNLGGEVTHIYETYLAGNQHVDWETVDQTLKNILLTPIDKRITPKTK